MRDLTYRIITVSEHRFSGTALADRRRDARHRLKRYGIYAEIESRRYNFEVTDNFEGKYIEGLWQVCVGLEVFKYNNTKVKIAVYV